MASEEKFDVQLPTELGRLASLIDQKPEALGPGDKEIQDAALVAAKYIFDLTLKSESRSQPHLRDLLRSLKPMQAPQTRAQARAVKQGKAKEPSLSEAILNETPLSALFVDGMDEEQVWAQLELKVKNVCETLEDAFDAGDMDARGMRASSDDDNDDDEDEEDELDSDDMEQLEKMGITFASGQGVEGSEESNGEEEEGDENTSAEEEELEETVEELRDPSSEEEVDEDDSSLDLDEAPTTSRPKRKRNGKRHAELDDGFFSLADFNAEIEEAEAKSVSRGSLSKDLVDDESENDDNVDLFAPVDDDTQLEEFNEGEEAFYKDFFDRPSMASRPLKRKAPSSSPASGQSSKVRFKEQVEVKRIKAKGRGRPLSSINLLTGEDLDDYEDVSDGSSIDDFDVDGDGIVEDEMGILESASETETGDLDQGREAVERLKDDLFADDDDDTLKSGTSTHEARMEAIRKQIVELEAENIAEKDWVLKGEVSSRSRPQNALLEEDLEFEHVMKAVPVVTDEVVQDLEEKIKARIIEGRFDDVVRKRPVDDKPFLPSRVFELQDTKSKESLAQIYENEFVASQTGGTTDDRDGKLRKEHEEIEKQWEGICYKLDALCNAHFTPKQPKATISTVSNVSAVSMESALPTSKSAATVLAPEEVFTPTASDLRSRSELAPAEKQALRAKERKKRKKQRETLEKSVDKFARMKGAKGVKRQKEEALKSIVKSGKGVTVIGKKSQTLKKGKQRT